MAQAQHGQNDCYSLNVPSDVKEFKMSRRRRRTRKTRTSKNGNENSKKAIGLDKQKNNFPVPNIMFYRERKQTTTNFSFSFWALIFILGTQLQESSPTLNIGEKAGIIALKPLLKRRFRRRRRRRCCMLQFLLFQRPWRPLGNQPLQTWQNKSMNRMDASLFDYKNRDQVHFSVTTKAFSLCQKMPYILSNLRDIYTSFHNTLPVRETD